MTLTWLPNTLTLTRCALAFGVGWLVLMEPPSSFWPMFAFVLIAATDFVDGWTARRFDAVTRLGAFLDPVADKLLVGLTLIALCVREEGNLVLVVPTVAIILRDLIATGLRLFPQIEMPVSRLAKWKTAIEMIAIGALLLAGPIAFTPIWTSGLVALWVAAALSVYTLGLYLGSVLVDTKRPHS